ncbi:MAG TPA: LLM class flavin-dependent oxidoreductase [Candidatus Limnocylindria bacterium]
MRFSTGLPNCREGRQNPMGSVDVGAITRAAEVADELGYYALWPNEFFVSRPDVSARYDSPPNLFDTIVTMAYALAVTKRIRVMPSTIVLPLHEPILLARQMATLDVFSGGRVTLGIGLGGDKEEYGRMRPDNPNRAKLMDEYVAAMRVLWTQRTASYQGKYVQFTDLETYPKPIQAPLPVFRAGHGEEAIKWIGREGQGWIDSSHSREEIKEMVAQLNGIAAEAGRKDKLEVVRQWYVCLGETESEAQDIFARSLPPPTKPDPKEAAAADSPATRSRLSKTRTLIGTPDQIRDELRTYTDSGVTEMCVIFYSPNVETAERQMRLFAKEVLPKF